MIDHEPIDLDTWLRDEPAVALDVDVAAEVEVEVEVDLVALAADALARSVARPASADPPPPIDASPIGHAQFPSAAFPGPPIIRIARPEGWSPAFALDADVVVRRDVPVDGVHPEVAGTVRRATSGTPGPLRLDEAGEVVSSEVRHDGPTPTRRLLVRCAGADDAVIVQRYLVAHVPVDAVLAHDVHLVGSWPASAGPEVVAEVEGIVASLLVLVRRDA